MFRQRPLKGGRTPLPACVMGKIWSEVNRDAKRFNVSRSFVIATILAHNYDIKGQEDYKTVERKRKN